MSTPQIYVVTHCRFLTPNLAIKENNVYLKNKNKTKIKWWIKPKPYFSMNNILQKRAEELDKVNYTILCVYKSELCIILSPICITRCFFTSPAGIWYVVRLKFVAQFSSIYCLLRTKVSTKYTFIHVVSCGWMPQYLHILSDVSHHHPHWRYSEEDKLDLTQETRNHVVPPLAPLIGQKHDEKLLSACPNTVYHLHTALWPWWAQRSGSPLSIRPSDPPSCQQTQENKESSGSASGYRSSSLCSRSAGSQRSRSQFNLLYLTDQELLSRC